MCRSISYRNTEEFQGVLKGRAIRGDVALSGEKRRMPEANSQPFASFSILVSCFIKKKKPGGPEGAERSGAACRAAAPQAARPPVRAPSPAPPPATRRTPGYFSLCRPQVGDNVPETRRPGPCLKEMLVTRGVCSAPCLL